MSSSKIHYFFTLFYSYLSFTLLHHSLSSSLLLSLILHLFLHLPPYSHPPSPSTHRYLHSSIILPNSLLPTHFHIHSSPITLTSIIRFLSLSSTFLVTFPFSSNHQLVITCPLETIFFPNLSLLNHFIFLSLGMCLFIHLFFLYQYLSILFITIPYNTLYSTTIHSFPILPSTP